jgi:aminopeptidase N
VNPRLCRIAGISAARSGIRSPTEARFNFDTTPGKLPKEVVPQRYDIRLKLDIDKFIFAGSEIAVLHVRKPVKSITLNVNEVMVESAKLLRADGNIEQTAHVTINRTQQTARLSFAKEIVSGPHQLSLEFAGTINEAPVGLYFTRYQEEGSGAQKIMVGTQMESSDARRMFPCWDEPSFRAKFRLTATVPSRFTTISNMPIESEKRTHAGKEVRFAETPPMPSYLVVFCAGELDAIYGEADGVKIGVVTTRSKAETGRYALDSAEKILKYYNDYFGERYPLPKLDLIAVPGGCGGAMENWGGITFYESLLLFDPAKSSELTKQNIFKVIAHEMAHQWFGDLVTMAWWDDLWLNEGFASWMGTKCSDYFNPQWGVWLRSNAQKQCAMATDALSSAHPIQQPVKTENDVGSAFDEITYLKSQSFLRMLENYLGERDFRVGIRRYIKAYKLSNCTTADLWNALAQSSKKPVAAIAASWTQQRGLPLVSVKSADSDVTVSQERFTVNQKNSTPLEWKIPIAYREVPSTTTAARVFLLQQKSATVPDIQPSQNVKLNAGDIGYFRTEYDSAHFEKLIASAAQLPEADKVNLVSDAWALVEAGRGSVSNYFKLVEALRWDNSLALWEQITATLSSIDFLYLGNPQRPMFQAYGRSILRSVFDRVSWEPKNGEETATGLLRVKLIAELGELADQGVIAGARKRFQKFVADSKTLPPNLRPTVLDVIGRYGNQRTWDTLHELGLKTQSIEEKGNFYHAMAVALAPELAERTLPLSLTDELPAARATFFLLNWVARSGEHPELAWEFAQAHREQLEAKLSPLLAVRFVPYVMRSFSDDGRATELEIYAQKYMPREAQSEVVKAAEEIRFKAKFKARILPEIHKWLGCENVSRASA